MERNEKLCAQPKRCGRTVSFSYDLFRCYYFFFIHQNDETLGLIQPPPPQMGGFLPAIDNVGRIV